MRFQFLSTFTSVREVCIIRRRSRREKNPNGVTISSSPLQWIIIIFIISGDWQAIMSSFTLIHSRGGSECVCEWKVNLSTQNCTCEWCGWRSGGLIGTFLCSSRKKHTPHAHAYGADPLNNRHHHQQQQKLPHPWSSLSSRSFVLYFTLVALS